MADYQVLVSTNLVDWAPIWTSTDPVDLSGATVAGAGTGERTVRVTVPPTNDAAFYKTIVE